ncbi:transglutaminase domain-containing protein [Patescibacteria group bacterium]
MKRVFFLSGKTGLITICIVIFACYILIHFLSEHNQTNVESIPQEVQRIYGISPQKNINILKFNLTDTTPVEFSLKDDQRNKWVYWAARNNGYRPVSPNFKINNKNFSSVEQIAQTMLKEMRPEVGDKETAIALFNFINNYLVHDKPPYYSLSEYSHPVPLFTQLGYAYCSDLSYAYANIATRLGLAARVVYIDNQHVVVEVLYDEKWHMFDSTLKIYFLDKSGDILSLSEIFADESVLPPVLGDDKWAMSVYTSKKIIRTVYKKHFVNLMTDPAEPYLDPGEEIRYYKNIKNSYLASYKKTEPKMYSNGVLTTTRPSVSNNREKIYSISLPYPILNSVVYGKRLCDYIEESWFSYDKKTWYGVDALCEGGLVQLKNFFETNIYKIVHLFYLRVPSEIKNTTFYTFFQFSPVILPQLAEHNTLQLLDTSGDSSLIKVQAHFVFKE